MVWETIQEQDLMQLIARQNFKRDCVNCWGWTEEEERWFTFISAYNILLDNLDEEDTSLFKSFGVWRLCQKYKL